MIKLRTSNLSKIIPPHGLSDAEIIEINKKLPELKKKVLEKDLGFHTVIDNESVTNEIIKFSNEINQKFEDLETIVVLGIGGSALGTICIQQALSNLFIPNIKEHKYPRLHVLDNIDPTLIKETSDYINPAKTLFIVVTKSGNTPETLSQYFYFRNLCNNNNLPPEKHFVFITDPKNGFLRKIANEEKIPSFEVPENVGGRFSVLTAVGLFPSALIGIDIKSILKSAIKMRDIFYSENPNENLPFILASIQYLLYKKGKNINVIMPYAQKLHRFSEWYKQLLAESIGKKLNNNNEEVFIGITPINAMGVTDQHSQSQLFNEGPNDKLHIFIKANNLTEEIAIPTIYHNEESVSYLKNISFNKLIETEMEGTIGALTQNDRPNITIEIDTINEESLGELFMLFECATAFLGEFLEINAFNQPGVELSKQLTKQLLNK